MPKDQYRKWEPIENIPTRLYLEALHDDYEGFRILLKGEDITSRTLRITFNSKLAYRNIDEDSFFETLKKIKEKGETTLYTVDDSSLVEWFHQESYEIYKSRKILHYAIYTPNDCIDVISEHEPIVEWLK